MVYNTALAHIVEAARRGNKRDYPYVLWQKSKINNIFQSTLKYTCGVMCFCSELFMFYSQLTYTFTHTHENYARELLCVQCIRIYENTYIYIYAVEYIIYRI